MAAFWILVAAAGIAAAVDWWAVSTRRSGAEYVAKPAVLALLTAGALALPAIETLLDHRRWWFVAALLACLVGDVLLMLPNDLFVPGLAAFLAGHALFIMGLLQGPMGNGSASHHSGSFSFSAVGLVIAVATVVLVEAIPGALLFRALWSGDQPGLVVPVAVYVGAIATMVVLAVNAGGIIAGCGAALFLVSDTTLALDRFVKPFRAGSVSVHVTYHLAQALLVISLVR